jgi:hypothetical protein
MPWWCQQHWHKVHCMSRRSVRAWAAARMPLQRTVNKRIAVNKEQPDTNQDHRPFFFLGAPKSKQMHERGGLMGQQSKGRRWLIEWQETPEEQKQSPKHSSVRHRTLGLTKGQRGSKENRGNNQKKRLQRCIESQEEWEEGRTSRSFSPMHTRTAKVAFISLIDTRACDR